MITPIRSINFFSIPNSINTQKQNRYYTNTNNTSCDSVSFSGKTAISKLSQTSIDLVQNFAQKLQLNKIYKFDNPNVEKFQMTSIATPNNPSSRTLLLQYSGYSKDNMTKHIMCTIKDNGEIYERGNLVKNPQEIKIYERIIPELINHASKELKVKN